MMNKNNLPEEAKTKQNEHMPHIKKIAVMLLAIIGGFMLWIYAIGYDSTMFERTFDGVEVVIEGEDALALNKGYTLAENQKFSSVTVVARGKRSELNELDSSDFRPVIDVSQAENAGDQTLNIVVYSPNGIEVVAIAAPSQVHAKPECPWLRVHGARWSEHIADSKPAASASCTRVSSSPGECCSCDA